MRDFSEFVTVEEDQLLFYFSRIYIAAGEEFFVSVKRSGKFYLFDLERDDSGKWKITKTAPAWLQTVEEELADIINQI